MSVAPVPESPGAWQSVEELTAIADGLGGGERLASMADGSATVPRAMVEAAGSSEEEAKVADAALEARVEKPVVLEEQTVLLKVSKDVVGHVVRPWSPRWCLQLRRRRTRWKRSNVRNLDPKLSESSANAATRWWLLRRRTPPGS